jgi:phage-related holin
MRADRTPTVVTYALASLARVPAILADSPRGSVSAAVLGVFSWLFAVSNTRLLSVVIAAMLANLVVGALWAAIDPKQDYDAHRLYGGIAGKLFRLCLIPVGSLIDKLFLLSPVGTAVGATQPVVAFLMWALAIAELVSTLQKFIEAGVVPQAVATLMARLEAAPGLALPAMGVPTSGGRREGDPPERPV